MSCVRRDSPSRSGRTTSPSLNSARWHRMASTTSPQYGWVNFGISHDTAAFAVASIRRWRQVLGAARYRTAKRLLINADCGGTMATACACGSGNYKSWLMNSGSPSPFTTCRLAPAVELTTGAVAVGLEGSGFRRLSSCRCLIGSDRCFVSSRRSSTRTCRFPASGFLLRHQAFALGGSVRRLGKAYRPSVS